MSRWLAVLALLLWLPAHAQVVTCTDSTQAGKTFASCQTMGSVSAVPAATALVLWCESAGLVSANSGMATCTNAQWLAEGQMQSTSWTWTAQGWQRNGSMVFPTVSAAPPPPPCLPKVTWPPKVAYGSVPAGVSTRAEMYAAWVCEQPTGFTTVAWLYNAAEIGGSLVKYAQGLITKAQADASCASTCWVPNAAEQAFLNQQLAINQPRAVVAFNGAKGTRNVFSANPDGTLNPVPIAGSSVAVAAACNFHNRLAGTTYYDVTGVADASQSGVTLQNVYALCVVSLPIGSN